MALHPTEEIVIYSMYLAVLGSIGLQKIRQVGVGLECVNTSSLCPLHGCHHSIRECTLNQLEKWDPRVGDVEYWGILLCDYCHTRFRG